MARGPEGKIQDAVVKHAKKLGMLPKKNETGRYFVGSGWPDYTIYVGGTYADGFVRDPRTFFVEFKAPGGKLTPLQKKIREELEHLGFEYYVVDDVAKGKQILDEENDK